MIKALIGSRSKAIDLKYYAACCCCCFLKNKNKIRHFSIDLKGVVISPAALSEQLTIEICTYRCNPLLDDTHILFIDFKGWESENIRNTNCLLSIHIDDQHICVRLQPNKHRYSVYEVFEWYSISENTHNFLVVVDITKKWSARRERGSARG